MPIRINSSNAADYQVRIRTPFDVSGGGRVGDPWEDFFGGTLAWGGGGDHPSLLRLRAAVQISLSTPFQAEVKGVAQK